MRGRKDQEIPKCKQVVGQSWRYVERGPRISEGTVEVMKLEHKD